MLPPPSSLSSEPKKSLSTHKTATKEINKENLIGMKPCNQQCNVCQPLSKECQSSQTKEKFSMSASFNSCTSGEIYLISCTKCNKQYIGQTDRPLKTRIMEHLQYV